MCQALCTCKLPLHSCRLAGDNPDRAEPGFERFAHRHMLICRTGQTPSLLDSYVDLHCLPDDDVETGASQETEEVCLRYLDALPLPGCGARRSHRDCEHLWHTIRSAVAPQAGRSDPPAQATWRAVEMAVRLCPSCGGGAGRGRTGLRRFMLCLAGLLYGEGPGRSRSGSISIHS